MIKDGKVVIDAVMDNDLPKLLKSIGQYERVVSGAVRCYVCKGTISIDNISGLSPLDGEVVYACQKNPLCFYEFNSKMTELKQ